jgi:hypothetical protein
MRDSWKTATTFEARKDTTASPPRGTAIIFAETIVSWLTTREELR